MNGICQIKIFSGRVRYRFVVSRNITVIQGASATGKTTLVDTPWLD